MKPTCIYCKKEIETDLIIETPEGITCSDCGVKPIEEPVKQETPPQVEQKSNSGDSSEILARCFRELQWVRFRQISNGETDSVIMKRSLTEILLMMDQQLGLSKKNIIKLEPDAALRSRFHLLSAVAFGLAYLSTHPSPH